MQVRRAAAEHAAYLALARCDAWSLDGSAILADAAFGVAKDHIRHPGQAAFPRATIAAERT
ncbi:MAG: hypothetical protein ACREDA_11300 [Methylocella sp.]